MTSTRLPRSAPEILARAAELGHVMAVERRGPWPEHGDPHQKIYVTCTCGFVASATRSEKAAQGTVAWHLGKAIGQAYDVTNGQASPAHPAAPAGAMRARSAPDAGGAYA